MRHYDSSAQHRPVRVGLFVVLGFQGLFLAACSTVRVREMPQLLSQESIEYSKALQQLSPQDSSELEGFARSSIDLLRKARRWEQVGRIEDATTCYLQAALDARRLMVEKGEVRSKGAEEALLGIHNHSLARFAELWSVDSRRAQGEEILYSAEGETFQVVLADGSDYSASYFDRAVAAGTLRGDGVVAAQREGYGAALVGVREQRADRVDELRFFPKRGLHVPISIVIENPKPFGSGGARRTLVPISIKNPMLTESVRLGDRNVPLAADFSASMEMLLKGRNDLLWGLKGFFEADKRIEQSGIYLLEPFDPDRIPVVLTHGLVSVPIIWRDLIPELMSEPEIAKRYQFMVFTYPSSFILAESALLFRQELAALREKYDPGGKAPLSNNMVAMGHSMGGMLTHLLVTEMGDTFWNELSSVPLEELDLSGDRRAEARALAFFDADPAVRRVVYMSTPHGGAKAADLGIANAISRLASLPKDVMTVTSDILGALAESGSGVDFGKKVTSVQSLSPESPMVRAMSRAPYKRGVIYHSIIADRGKGDTPNSSDGIVEYWSSHQPGAASEIIVPTGHTSYTHPRSVAEIKRILREHVGLR